LDRGGTTVFAPLDRRHQPARRRRLPLQRHQPGGDLVEQEFLDRNVSSTGVVMGVAAGTATITVTTGDGGKTVTCAATISTSVVAVAGVSLNQTSASIVAGTTVQLAATVSSAQSAIDTAVIGSNYTDGGATWAFMGAIDDLRFYNRELSAAEVSPSSTRGAGRHGNDGRPSRRRKST
jgi:hypothetical protein